MSFSLFIKIALSAFVPIVGLRGSIPFFIATHPETPIWFITLATIIGDVTPVFIILWILPRLTRWTHDKGAEKINHAIMWTHDFFIKRDRITYLLLGFITLNTLEWFIIFEFGLKNKLFYLGSILINSAMVFFIYLTSKKAKVLAEKEKNIINWFYNKVHQKHSKRFYRWGSLALFLLVCTPIPAGGSTTGAILAFLFNIPYWRAVGLIFLGITVAATTVTLAATGIIDFINWL